VTVYQDQARITREISLELLPGDNMLLLERLPQTADEQSFRASASGVPGVTIRALSVKSVEQTERPQTKAADLERQIQQIEREKKRALSDRLAAFSAQKELLSAISSHAGELMASQVSDNRLNVAEWEATLKFVGAGFQRIGDSMRITQTELEDVGRQIDRLRSELTNLAQPQTKRTRTVTVNLEMKAAGKATITLEYIVPRASWKPLYDARLVDDSGHVELSYNAEISQQTGEDWTDVELTLSTATPSRGVGPGEFMPRYLTQHSTEDPLQWGSAYPTGVIRGRILDKDRGEPVVGASVRVAGTKIGAMTDPHGNYVINGVPSSTYTLEVSAVGYQKMEVANVAVTPGLARQVDVAVPLAMTELADVIRVTAKQDILNKFETSSRSTITAQTNQTRPVQTVDNLLKAVSEARTTSDGQVYIRGNRAGEVAYIIDGIPVGDPLGGLSGGLELQSRAISDFSTADLASQNHAVTFKVPRKESVPAGEQTVRTTIARWTLGGTLRLVSRPRNIDGAYRLLTAKNQETAPLLPGKVAIFAGSDYLGTAGLNQVIAPNQTFELPFGLDQALNVKRTLVVQKKSDGGKTRLDYAVGITAVNHGTAARTLDLEESLPVSRDTRVKISLDEILPKPTSLGDDGKGRWTLSIAPGDSVVVSIPYRITYPRGLDISER
jgi:hypothetical protein